MAQRKPRIKKIQLLYRIVIRDCKNYLKEFRSLKRDFLYSFNRNKETIRWKEYKIESLDGILYSKELVAGIDPVTMAPYSQIQYIYVYQIHIDETWKKVFTKEQLTDQQIKEIYTKWKQ